MPTDDPLIVTVAFDPDSTALFQSLRDRHFPADRNIVPAHLTLFHHLPGAEHAAVLADLNAVATTAEPFAFATAGPRFLGRGCALTLAAGQLELLRAELARRWRGWLTPQDRQAFHPHVTVQNKVPPDVARALCATLSIAAPIRGHVEGFDLWIYRGGPWRFSQRIVFGSTDGAG